LARPERIPTLKPVLRKDGTVTAANASSISDGGAAVLLMSSERAKGVPPATLLTQHRGLA
jgi:acetyl-CoA C-acetyltransferase